MGTENEWLKVGIGFVSGGLAGALFTFLTTLYRNRIQPVAKRIEITPLFKPEFSDSPIVPTITITSEEIPHQFSNLHVADIQVINRGNRDFTNFSFGITLSDGDDAIHIDFIAGDRHHCAVPSSPVSPSHKESKVDFTLTPFNRGDSYQLRVFIVSKKGKPGEISISTSEAVRFTNMPSISEALVEVASASAIYVGPFRLSIR